MLVRGECVKPKCPKCGEEMEKAEVLVMEAKGVEQARSIDDSIVGYVCKNEKCQKPPLDSDSEGVLDG